MKDNGEFRSTDLALSAFLLTSGHRLIRIDLEGHKGVFVFSRAEIGDDPIKFLNGQARVEPGNYQSSIRKLKGSLNEVLRN